MTTGIWVLTKEVNDYNQHGAYFVRAWVGKPTEADVKKEIGVSDYQWNELKYGKHIMAGGGRINYEYDWYILEEQ